MEPRRVENSGGSKNISDTLITGAVVLAFVWFPGAIIFAIAGPDDMQKLKLLIAGSACLYIGVLAPVGSIATYLSTTRARNWVRTPAVILRSGIKISQDTMRDGKHRSINVTIYRPEFTFEYSYRGRTYQSNVAGDVVGSNNQAMADATLAKYPVGATVHAYVNPKKPDEAQLVFDPKQMLGIPLIGIGMGLGFGFFGVMMLFER